MIIAQISDTHIDLDCPDTDGRLRDFEQTIADVNALDPQPDVIIHTGDIVHNGRQDEYGAAKAILSKARAPVYVMAGNKDDRANLHAAFAGDEYLPPEPDFIDYVIEGFPVRVIVLDTKMLGSNKGDFCDARAGRLIDMIDSESNLPIAVFAHHPPYVVNEGPDPHHFGSRDMAVRLRRALRHSNRVIAVFTGHVHRAVWGDVAGIPGSSMPSIATSLRKGDYPAGMKNQPVYHIHRFEPGGHFTTETRIVRSDAQKPLPHIEASHETQALSRP